ncbi:hypothetical protein [Rhodovulum sulfidophilum]|uniref:hypothetical protein n=1 Tax=Rhodovulum sulfidophilum TaxID=35806 RepID=UPI001924B88E|nr:hypothetical protein [Rhodovulum sulfidophilum]MBL3561512.1 hypothetical protein [Rhodovulum sulfidophilum]
MNDAVFPFGNDPMHPEAWVGHMDTRSKRWLISYDGSFSMVCGYHSFIFLGLDNMCIGIVNLLNCGVSASLPIGKLFKGAGGSARAAQRIEDAHGHIGDGKMTWDAAKMEHEQDQIGSGMALYERMTQGTPQFVSAHKPFSLADLSGMTGGIIGAEVELVGAAALYTIDASPGPLGDPVFGPTPVFNSGDGLVSAGASAAIGIWSLETWFNLYYELGATAQLRCRNTGQSPSYDQPYRVIPSLDPYLAALPPAGCTFAETGFDPTRLLP